MSGPPVFQKAPRGYEPDHSRIVTSPGDAPEDDEMPASKPPPLPKMPPSGGSRGVRPYRFQNLERISRSVALLVQRLEWLMPSASGRVMESIGARMKELFEDEVGLLVDYVNVLSPAQLKSVIGEPTFLAILAPAPHKTRGLLEIELGLAHAAIDHLLGGSGETVAHRPLTDIEEGVISYVVLDALKTLAPNMEPGLPRMRLDGIARGVDEAIRVLGDEQQVVVVQFKGTLGAQGGFLRLFIPSTIVGMTNPPAGGPERRARRRNELEWHVSRLSTVQTILRIEIGRAEITTTDLTNLRTGDVVVADEMLARPDQNQGGTARLKVGLGRAAWINAELAVEGQTFKAKIAGFVSGGEPTNVPIPTTPAPAPATGDKPTVETAPINAESANVAENAEGVDLLNDIPLQLAIELGRVPITAEEVVALKVGQVIDLNKMPGEPIEMSVNGKVVARGELVEIDGRLGVRILSLLG